MFKRCFSFILIVLFSTVIQAAEAESHREKDFDTLVVFGDSLSDTGNLYNYLWGLLPASPPYYQGRFSNGPVWIDYLHETYFPNQANQERDKLQNYALGGAGAILSLKLAHPFVLSAELRNFFYWHGDEAQDRKLFSIWIGANNYIREPEDVEAITDEVTEAIIAGVEKLIAQGGSKFLIINLPDLADLPYAQESQNPQLLSDLTLTHNRKLEIKAKELQEKYLDKTFIYVDMYGFFKNSVSDALTYGFTNIAEACYAGSYHGFFQGFSLESLKSRFKRVFPAKLNQAQWETFASTIKHNVYLREVANNVEPLEESMLVTRNMASCDGYVFWDKLHPTTELHRLIAKHIQAKIAAEGLKPMDAKE